MLSEIWTPDNIKEIIKIYINEIIKKTHIYPTGTRSRSPVRLGTAHYLCASSRLVSMLHGLNDK
jgi:hypothetical protein